MYKNQFHTMNDNYMPKVKPNHLLAMPLTLGDRPPCAYFIKEYTKNSETIRLEKLL